MKLDRHFNMDNVIVDLFKSLYELFEMYITEFKKTAYFSKVVLVQTGAIF